MDTEDVEGLRAYALRQANMQRELHHHFQKMWLAKEAPVVGEEEEGENEADRMLTEEAGANEDY